MEYRMKYRDIPWGVAVAVLPGKIVGRCIIDPLEWMENNRYKIRKKIRVILWTFMKWVAIIASLGFLFTVGVIIADLCTDGVFLDWIRDELPVLYPLVKWLPDLNAPEAVK